MEDRHTGSYSRNLAHRLHRPQETDRIGHISLKKILFIAVISGIAIFLIAAFFMMAGNETPKQIVPDLPILGQSEEVQPQKISGLPVRLKIPKLQVDAAIEYVGLTPEGSMAVPKGPANAAWFRLGPNPGEIGSAVIAGHFGWKDGVPAVFDDLYTLRKGDIIHVIDDAGVTSTFSVREVLTYGDKDEASYVFYSSDGLAHLNLITCEGIWSKAEKSYSGRLVVFSDKQS